MKAINLFLLVAILTLGSCDMTSRKNDQGESPAVDSLTQEESAAIVQPTRVMGNYAFFEQAILALGQGEQAAAVTHLQSGIDGLIEEGNKLEGEARIKIDSAIADLEATKLELQQGQLQNAAQLKEAIARVQLRIPQRLLADAPAERIGVQE